MIKNRVITICIVAFTVFALCYAYFSDKRFNKLMESEGVFTIGTIENVKSLTKGGPLSTISYYFRNSVRHGEYIGDISMVPKPHVGKRFFIKIIPDHPGNNILFKPQCLVPDSIQTAPERGWSLVWMKEHFPECVN